MNSSLRELCDSYLTGQISDAELVQSCLRKSSATLSEAEVDLDRVDRCGFPEVIFAERKPIKTLVEIATELSRRDQPVLVTRVDDTQSAALCETFPDGIFHPVGRTFRVPRRDAEPKVCIGKVPVVTAGTGDQAVAWEAVETLAWMNVNTIPLFDLGVAGPHRLPARVAELADADAVVVAAGMEGALPSVVGGYVDCPVIAVPTSVGYGANFQGLSALLSMLNSCAANVAVVNIDAGFKAGYLAGMIAHGRRRDR